MDISIGNHKLVQICFHEKFEFKLVTVLKMFLHGNLHITEECEIVYKINYSKVPKVIL